jgi:hypothetical protein
MKVWKIKELSAMLNLVDHRLVSSSVFQTGNKHKKAREEMDKGNASYTILN